jgi:hypothetical protein
MKALAHKNKYQNNLKGRIAQYFSMKDDSGTSFLVEILGGIVMYLSACKYWF